MNPRRASLTFALLASLVLNAAAVTRYVDLNSPSPTPPYTNWLTAATNIQDAVDAAVAGETVLVTNGLYATGGKNWANSGTNRVTLTNSVNLQGVNGPAVTIIEGTRGAGTNIARCALLTAGSSLSGFTLTNGQFAQGGGVNCSSVNVIISNCVLVGNVATDSGGGAYSGTLVNCVLKGNSATNNGGGAYTSKLTGCSITGNFARVGGGVYTGKLTNCVLFGNSASVIGGGAWSVAGDRFFNCTIVSNTAGDSGGVREGLCENCIVYYNTASSSPNGFAGYTEWICRLQEFLLTACDWCW